MQDHIGSSELLRQEVDAHQQGVDAHRAKEMFAVSPVCPSKYNSDLPEFGSHVQEMNSRWLPAKSPGNPDGPSLLHCERQTRNHDTKNAHKSCIQTPRYKLVALASIARMPSLVDCQKSRVR